MGQGKAAGSEGVLQQGKESQGAHNSGGRMAGRTHARNRQETGRIDRSIWSAIIIWVAPYRAKEIDHGSRNGSESDWTG